MNKLITFTLTFLAICSVLLWANITPSQASGKGTFKGLYFPGADSQKCGGWYVASPQTNDSQWVSFQRPGNVTYTVFDGSQNIVMQGSQNIFNGYASNVDQLRLPAFGLPNANWGAAKNPIRVVVTVDGDTVADLTADNPCLSGSAPANSSAPSQAVSGCGLRTSYDGLRARSEPGVKFAVIGGLSSGVVYPVLAKGSDSSGAKWWEVSITGVGDGWVNGAYITTTGDCSGVPAGGAALQSQPASSSTQSLVCTVRTQTDGLRLRSGPGSAYQQVGQMESGKDYTVLAKSSDTHGARWWEINGESLGSVWASGSFVTTHGNCTGVPVVAAPPTS